VNATWFNTLNALGISVLLLWELRSRVFLNVLRDPRRMRRNLAFLGLNVSVALLLHQSTAYLSQHLPQLTWSAPLWLQLLLVFLLAELMNWALHAAKHANNFLWRIHCQHHREDQYSVWLITHTYGPEVLLSGTLMATVILSLGFSKLALDCYLLFYSIVNLYQHSGLPHSLGILDRLIINPAFHRQHHSGARANYGSTLTIWDWVFRTARWPSSRRDLPNPPPLDQAPEPFGFVAEMLYPLMPSRWVDSRTLASKR
jgi:sterol desaturase/sphingolipid hydroxylase (fatty acid hydroxylase superfamily)